MPVRFYLTLSLLILLGVPVVATASTSGYTSEQAGLLVRIAELQAEVKRLQALFQSRSMSSSTRVPYQAVLFTKPVESSYFVDGGVLVPSEKSRTVRTEDRALYAVFTATIGEAVVARSVAEWRVFADTSGVIDAYVERVAGTDQYVVNVNRASFDLAVTADREVLKELFIHEYAHMLFLSRPLVTEAYQKKFWSRVDQAVSQKNSADRRSYFTQNKTSFVSEYALQSVDEDMAETFLFGVVYPHELGVGKRREKYEFFRTIPDIAVEIDRLRSRLNSD